MSHQNLRPAALQIAWLRPLLALTLLVAIALSGQAAVRTDAQELAATATLTYGTYVGGASDDWGQDVATDAQGNVIITGYTYSAQFPGTTGTREDRQVFVTKLNPSGSAVIFSKVFGGSDDDEGRSVAVDAQGAIWVTGATESNNFPVSGPLAGSYSGGNYYTFVAKLSATGEILMAGYFGDESSDLGNGIALDPQGNMYIAAASGARFGPVVLVMKLAANGESVIYKGYFGEADHGFDRGTNPNAIAVNASGQAYIVGRTNTPAFPVPNGLYTQCGDFGKWEGDCDSSDAFLSVVNAEGTDLIYGSYLGGRISDEALGVALDKDENIYITGTTFGNNFPVKNAFQSNKVGMDNFADGFLTKLSKNGDSIIFSTYYAGDKWEEPAAVVVDSAGNAYIGGLTSTNDLPVPGALQNEIHGICITGSSERWCYDGFVASFSPTGSLNWATYLGGAFDDSVKGLALTPDGGIIAGGRAESHDFPTTAGSFQPVKALADDAFIVKIGGTPNGGGDNGGGDNGGDGIERPYKAALPYVSR